MGEESLWQSLLSSTRGESGNEFVSPVVVVGASTYPSSSFPFLLNEPSSSSLLPMQYGLIEGRLPCYYLHARLDSHSLLSTIVLPSSSSSPCLYVADIVVSSSPDHYKKSAGGDVFSSLKAQVNVVCEVLKEQAGLSFPQSFPLNPASPPSLTATSPLPVLFAVTIDTVLFEGTYVKKQAFAYLTYCLVSYAASTGCGVIFLPSSSGEKEDERRAAFRSVVMATAGLDETNNNTSIPAEDGDEFYLYLLRGGISKEYVEFLRDNSGCKNLWEADCEFDNFVLTVLDAEEQFKLNNLDAGEDEVEQKAEMEAVSSYDWMRSLQTNMESDTAQRKSARKEKKEEAEDTPSKKTEDVSSFFADLMAK